MALPDAADLRACVPPSALWQLMGVLRPGGAHAAGGACAASAARDRAAASEGAAAPPSEGRLLLVLWFGGGAFEWRRGGELLPFGEYRRMMEGGQAVR
jgi:hypothetical protein